VKVIMHPMFVELYLADEDHSLADEQGRRRRSRRSRRARARIARTVKVHGGTGRLRATRVPLR
jgi:hypothetical protein